MRNEFFSMIANRDSVPVSGNITPSLTGDLCVSKAETGPHSAQFRASSAAKSAIAGILRIHLKPFNDEACGLTRLQERPHLFRGLLFREKINSQADFSQRVGIIFPAWKNSPALEKSLAPDKYCGVGCGDSPPE